ncbi:hypothetical protein DMP17_12825 [Pseudonocardia sp. TMWB2A]|uniref:MipA/OmpV family protein n=1 Tax=Pseudonocardia sp. TMWB2A TaxID=687430 RepID=UPI00307FC9B1
MTITSRLLACTAIGLVATPAWAQDSSQSDTAPRKKSDYNVMIGIGPKTKPSYPGADENKIIPLPVVNVWRDSERFPVSTPDENFGLAVIGKRGQTSFGPTLGFATQRKGKDAIQGLSDVKFGMEAGAFAETYLAPMFRLRGELRQGIGAHKALTGDVAADFVVRTSDDKVTATIGPRMRWASGKYNRAFFGVDTADAAATGLPYYRPRGGVYAYGAMAGAYYNFNPSWGMFGFAGYDRLTGDAAKSPIVTHIGSRDQYSAGIAVTYRFKVKR